MELLEFDIDRKIDPDQLDVECIKQADVFFRWAERAVVARGEADRLKLALETLQAGLELAARKDPAKYGLEKPTEAAIKAVVATHPDYLAATNKYYEARDNAAILDKAVVALEMKKRMLETLVTLHGQQYFAGPSAPRDLKRAWALQQEEAVKRVAGRQAKIVRKRSGAEEGLQK